VLDALAEEAMVPVPLPVPEALAVEGLVPDPLELLVPEVLVVEELVPDPLELLVPEELPDDEPTGVPLELLADEFEEAELESAPEVLPLLLAVAPVDEAELELPPVVELAEDPSSEVREQPATRRSAAASAPSALDVIEVLQFRGQLIPTAGMHIRPGDRPQRARALAVEGADPTT
jgi:hypothetical protein